PRLCALCHPASWCAMWSTMEVVRELTPARSDALVFFGASGDLAFKDIFPALQGLAATGQLDMPVLGVARAPWSRDDLINRARESIEAHGGIDREAFDQLARSLQYVRGDYEDPATFARIRE